MKEDLDAFFTYKHEGQCNELQFFWPEKDTFTFLCNVINILSSHTTTQKLFSVQKHSERY
jgi:hypothetical protein